MKAFADDNVAKMMDFVLDVSENIVWKRENDGNYIVFRVSSFPTMFCEVYFLNVVKSCDYVVKGKVTQNWVSSVNKDILPTYRV